MPKQRPFSSRRSCPFTAAIVVVGFTVLPLFAQQSGDGFPPANSVAVNLLLPPAFQAAEGAPPVPGDAPPNLRPPEFETIQPMPPAASPAAPVYTPPPASSPVPAPVPVVPVDPQAPVMVPDRLTPVPAPEQKVYPQDRPVSAVRAVEEPLVREVPVHDSPQDTMVSTQPEVYDNSGASQYRPMGQRKSNGGRVIGQRYEALQAPSQSRVNQPTRPLPDNVAARSQGGFYPTQAESPILAAGNADYTRAEGDRGYWAAQGIWPVRPTPDNFYQRSAFLNRVERGLRTVIPGQNVLYHSPDPDFLSIDLDYGFGVFSEDLASDKVMLKLGPLYLDFLGISATALFTDYSGDTPLPDGVDSDGWISIIGMPIRAGLRITDTIYIQSSLFLYFLPGEGEFGAGTGIGSGFSVGTNARLNVEWENGPWMFRLYDYFGVSSALASVFESWEVGEVDAVGRYRFGNEILDNSPGGAYWDPTFGGYRNDIGFEFQRPFKNEWWLLGSVVHSDYWAHSDLEDHQDADRFDVSYTYMGDDYMFAPSFGYRSTTTDHFDTISHEVYARVTGRVTEYLSAFASVGYVWGTGDNADLGDGSFTWDVGLNHDLTQYTRHSISGGQVYTLSEQLDEYLGQYVRYTISHSVNERLRLSAYAQYQDTRRLGDGADFRGYNLGGQAGYTLGEDTNITAGINYQSNNPQRTGTEDSETWLYYATLQRPILARMNGNITYQYVDSRGREGSNFKEHLLMMSVNYAY